MKEEMEVLSCAQRKEIFKVIYFVCKTHICQVYSSAKQNKLSGQWSKKLYNLLKTKYHPTRK